MLMLCTMFVAAGGPTIHLFIRLAFCVSTNTYNMVYVYSHVLLFYRPPPRAASP